MNRLIIIALLLVSTLSVGTHFSTFCVADSDQLDSAQPSPLTTHHSPLTPQDSRLAIIQKAPDFSLSTHSGDKLSSADLKGKILLVSFIFTTCNGTCPATTHRMTQIQEELKTRGLLKDDRVRLLSISLDPVRDTPEVLRGYMKLYDADPAHWTFLTGPPEKVTEVIKAWGMWARPAANGQLDHPSRIFLVDPRYRIREIYNLNFLKPKWVAQDVELLLNESQ
jgi:protein SCO1/2